MLEIGANRAIDLIVTKESGGGGRFGGNAPGRVVGDHPDGGAVSVKAGRFGSYVNHGKINATLPKGTDPEKVTLEEAIALLAAKGTAGGGGGGRVLGEHPGGGNITVQDGRFGAYVKLGKVNATIPKSMGADTITLQDAIELIDAKGGAPSKGKKAPAGKAGAKKAPAKKPAAKAKTIEDSDEAPFADAKPSKTAAKAPARKAAAKKAAKKPAKKAAKKG